MSQHFVFLPAPKAACKNSDESLGKVKAKAKAAAAAAQEEGRQAQDVGLATAVPAAIVVAATALHHLQGPEEQTLLGAARSMTHFYTCITMNRSMNSPRQYLLV